MKIITKVQFKYHFNINCTLEGFWVFYLEMNLIEDQFTFFIYLYIIMSSPLYSYFSCKIILYILHDIFSIVSMHLII